MPTPEGINGDPIEESDYLRAEGDRLLARMQEPGVMEAVHAAFGREPTVSDYGVYGMPGLRVDFVNGEYVVAQQLKNGFTLVWSTDKNAPEIMADFMAMGTDGMSASYMFEGSRGMEESEGDHIVSDLQLVGDACRYVKLRGTGRGDHVVFNSVEITETDRSQVAVMGPFLGADEVERVSSIRVAIEASATPAVLGRVDWILERVIGTVTAEAS